MKRISNIAFLLFLYTAYVHAGISGDGNVTSEKRNVSEFRHLTINGPFKIVFSDDPHSDFYIRIETDHNLQQYVTVTQMGNDAFVNIKPGISIESFTKMVLYVDNRDIHALTINSNSREKSEL